MSNEVILFFDGVCGLCNNTIDFFIKKDKEQKFKYSPLQGQAADKLLGKEYTQDLNTVVLYIDGKTYTKSTAIFKSLALLGFPYDLLTIFLILPKPLLNFFYNRVADIRYKVFGKKDHCRIPTKEERSLFLD